MNGVATIRSSIATVVIIYNTQNETLLDLFDKLQSYLENSMWQMLFFKYV